MQYPSFDGFQALAKTYNLIPVYREVTADLDTPISVFLKLCGDEPGAFLLESVEGGERVARYSFLGCRPLFTLTTRDGVTRVEQGEEEPVRELQGNPLEHLRQVMREFKVAPSDGRLPRFAGGFVGYLAYDAVRYFESHVPIPEHDELNLPDAAYMLTELVCVFDHIKHKLIIIALTQPGNDPEAAYRRALSLLDRATERLRGTVPVPGGLFGPGAPRKFTFTSNHTAESHAAMVRKAQEYIAAGDIFQVVLSQRLQTRVRLRPIDIYRTLRTINPSPYMYFLSMGDLKIIGASPEMLVRVEDGIAQTRPIAGTAPRSGDDVEDAARAAALLQDQKECAEHVMLVDLGRNDLGRVCDYGSVQVREPMHIERFSHVMHIVSEVQGRLRADKDAFDALMACFPAGTLSGAPKVRAMQIIDELEQTRRGPYGGAVGYFDFHGNMDTAICIRTMVMKGDKVYVQAGGGIVADSDPQKEYEETLHKAGAVLKTLELAEEGLL